MAPEKGRYNLSNYEGNPLGEDSKLGRGETARFDAFSDGVFAIAITILALELRVPHVDEVTAGGLARALLNEWPSYFAFLLSFSTILIVWINHRTRMSLLERVDGLMVFGNGLLLMSVAALSFPTALVGEYLTGSAGKTAVVTYVIFVIAVNGSWNIVMLGHKPERGLLRAGVPAELIAKMRRRQALTFLVCLSAIPVALVHKYLGLGLIVAMWGFFGWIAYGTTGRELTHLSIKRQRAD